MLDAKSSESQTFQFDDVEKEKHPLNKNSSFEAVCSEHPLLKETVDNMDSGNDSLGVMHSGLYIAPCLSLRHVQSMTSEILPHLLISTAGDGLIDDEQFLRDADIKFLVNCCEENSKHGGKGKYLEEGKGFTVLNLDLKDNSQQKLNDAFEQFFPVAERAKKEKKKCLIYCHSGMSRSVSLVLAYLLACESMSLIDALSHVKERRMVASPNPGFMAQLVQLEKTLTASVTVDMERYKKDRFGDPLSFALQIRASFEQDDDEEIDAENQMAAANSTAEHFSKKKNHRRKKSGFNFSISFERENDDVDATRGLVNGDEEDQKREQRHRTGGFNFSFQSSQDDDDEEVEKEEKVRNKPSRQGHRRVQSDISIVFYQGDDTNDSRSHKRSDSDVSIFFGPIQERSEKSRHGHRRNRSDISIVVKQNHFPPKKGRDRKHQRSSSDISMFLQKIVEEDETESQSCHRKRSNSDVSFFLQKVFEADEHGPDESVQKAKTPCTTGTSLQCVNASKLQNWQSHPYEELGKTRDDNMKQESIAHEGLNPISPSTRNRSLLELDISPPAVDGAQAKEVKQMQLASASPKGISGSATGVVPFIENLSSFVSSLVTCASAVDMPEISFSGLSSDGVAHKFATEEAKGYAVW